MNRMEGQRRKLERANYDEGKRHMESRQIKIRKAKDAPITKKIGNIRQRKL